MNGKGKNISAEFRMGENIKIYFVVNFSKFVVAIHEVVSKRL